MRPFDGATSAVIFEALLDRAPVPVRERNPKVSPDLERIIGRLLDKDRETRYQSAADVRADLKRVERDSFRAAWRPCTAPPRSRRSPQPRGGRDRGRPAGARRRGRIGLFDEAVGAGHFPSEYIQLTNFTDSAVAPSLSTDGRMVHSFAAASPS